MTGWCLVGDGDAVIGFWMIVEEQQAANSILTDKISSFRF
jgi:hypothetical protein